MGPYCYLFGLTVFCALYAEIISIYPSRMKVFTYFTDARTWNEASQLCQNVQRNLVSIGSKSDEDVLTHYFTDDWSNHTDLGPVWTGKLWMNKAQQAPIFFDCVLENSTSAPTGDQYCTHVSPASLPVSRTTINWDYCNETRPFVCEAGEGYCWFSPLDLMEANPPGPTSLTLTGVEADECAKECQMNITSDMECWGFTFDNDTKECELFFKDAPFIDDSSELTPSMSKVFYKKICYTSQLYNKSTDPLKIPTDTSKFPKTDCDTAIDPTGEPPEEICYCECDEEPDMRAPTEELLSLEQKIELIVSTLTVDPKNTSKEHRKLVSAYDPRPSAQNIGICGIVVLSVVFSGIVILDLELVIRGASHLKEMVTNAFSSPENSAKN